MDWREVTNGEGEGSELCEGVKGWIGRTWAEKAGIRELEMVAMWKADTVETS